MLPTKPPEDPGFVFIANERYVIGSPNNVKSTDEVIELSTQELTDNYELQDKLCLASRNFSNPTLDRVANYLSAFETDKNIKDAKEKYLRSNGQLRIIITDAALKEEVRKILE